METRRAGRHGGAGVTSDTTVFVATLVQADKQAMQEGFISTLLSFCGRFMMEEDLPV